MCLMSLLMLTCMNGSGTSAFTLLPARSTITSTSTSSTSTTRSININSLKESQTMLFLSSINTSSSASQQEQQQEQIKVQQSQRRIASIQKFARIPVWPAWNGALLFLLSLLPNSIMPYSTIAKLEDLIGGRVCPNFFDTKAVANNPSPFLMLVHHSHSFTSIDPLRKFQSSVILPEGFPAHPHRGFITLTYCIKGGMIHRDSLGCKQSYGAQERHQGNVAQWLIAGAGMLHEEMWDVVHGKDGKGDKGDGLVSKQELFQLWVNLPAQHKMTNPRVTLLNTNDNHNTGNLDPGTTGTNDEVGNLDHETVAIPMVQTEQSKTLILIGEYENVRSDVETLSPMSILHVQIQPNGSWQMTLPDSFKTGILYMRTGSASCSSSQESVENEIGAHYTATLTPYGNTFQLKAGQDGADFMLLVGEPLYEPVQAQGSMVMNDPEEINVAYDDYQRGLMGRPWEHTLTDEEWELHVSKFPSVYR